MRILLLLLVAACTLTATAQKKWKPEKFAKTITTQDLQKHLYIIAGKEMEGRETATPGQRKAAAYIENEFRRIGLQPLANGSYQQYYNVYQDSLVDAKLEINGTAYSLDKDFNPVVNSNISGTFRFSEVTFVTGDTNAIKAADLGGRLIMIVGASTMNRQTQMAMQNILRNKGVVAVMNVSSTYPRSTPMQRKGNQSLNGFRSVITAQQYNISEGIAKMLMGNDWDSAKTVNAQIKTYPAEILLKTDKITNTLQSSNVAGLLPGTDKKDEYLYITAHYDHLGKRDTVIYYGADDDGSGTCAVMELAEAFAAAKKDGKGPRRSIIFMTVSGEEKGLWGSEYYSNHPLVPLEKTTADLNIDMIGRIDATRKTGDSTNYVYVVGDDKLSSDLKMISEAQNKKYVKMELDYKFNDANDPNRIYFRSDHYNFARKGVPIIFYYDGMLGADYHKPTDTPDKINYTLYAKRAQLVFYTAWEMANRNDMLKRDIKLEIPRR
jgi:hypothetical protein